MSPGPAAQLTDRQLICQIPTQEEWSSAIADVHLPAIERRLRAAFLTFACHQLRTTAQASTERALRTQDDRSEGAGT
ncbi:hypothetical protein SAMN05445504_8341 [Burkholderia sp. CF099]|nr:hypothetical protein SAMN05445504_8341 [Burkholderia sp. CF099]